MIAVTIDVNGQRVALLKIRNDGTGTDATGNYDVSLERAYARVDRARVESWDRKRPAHELVAKALEAVGKP